MVKIYPKQNLVINSPCNKAIEILKENERVFDEI